MASHVVVIDSTARRAEIKVSPNTHLSDVLEEARNKLKATSSSYGLKHNNKAVDLSRTFRLSGLSSGAKLQLVQLSRSATVVSVALQLPESEGNTRLTDKFLSDTSLWLILRNFEAGVAGDGSSNRNLTARGEPTFSTGSSGAGRIYYQTPVIQIMGRELTTFTDMQKSLAQLGFNSGSVLLRLSFRMTETPLEEAMEQISRYFTPAQSATDVQPEEKSELPPEVTNDFDTEQSMSKLESPQLESVPAEDIQRNEPEKSTSQASDLEEPPSLESHPSSDQTSPLTASRSVQIFAPPSSSTPSAALTFYNPADYVPTIEHAKSHQRHLQGKSRNTRLLSEAQLAEQEAAEVEKMKAYHSVEIRIRFPDQHSIQTTFGQHDTAGNLYSFVRDKCLDEKWKEEKFVLSYSDMKVGWAAVPDSASKRLIQNLGFKGRVLVNFKWDETGGASVAALGTKDVLSADRKQEAQALKPPTLPDNLSQQESGQQVDLDKKDEESGDKKKKGMPKWLKLPGKK